LVIFKLNFSTNGKQEAKSGKNGRKTFIAFVTSFNSWAVHFHLPDRLSISKSGDTQKHSLGN
jgi:hypothetical protein